MRADDPRRDPSVRNHYVYRYYDESGVLLYVGCSLRPLQRWKEHQSDHREMAARVASCRMQGPYNYDTARDVEADALATENPVYANTPHGQAEKQRRYGWIKRQMRQLVTEDATTDEYMAIYRRLASKADRMDFSGPAVNQRKRFAA